MAAGWRATWLRPARCRLGSAGKASAVPAGCKPLVPEGPVLFPGLVSMVTEAQPGAVKLFQVFAFHFLCDLRTP